MYVWKSNTIPISISDRVFNLNYFRSKFSHFQWNTFLNKFFSEISIVTSIITYLRTADYSFWVVNGFMISDANCQLFIFLYFEW